MEEKNEELKEETKTKKSFLNNKKTVKGKALTAWIIVIIIIAMIVTFGSGLIVGKLLYEGKKKNSNTVIDNTNSEIPNNTDNTEDTSKININELINIAGFDYDATDSFFAPLLYNDGIIEELDFEKKTNIVYVYALRNQLLGSVSGQEYEGCFNGSGSCQSIKKDYFEDIAKKYGLTPFTPDCIDYKDMYLFTYGGSTSDYSKVSHEYSYKVVDENVIFTDTVHFTAASYATVGDKTEVKEFTFKKNSITGDYYLYSVYTK